MKRRMSKGAHGFNSGCSALAALAAATCITASAANGPCTPTWDNTIGIPGLNSNAFAMVVHEGDLYVAGQFTMSGGQMLNRIARWDGSAWHPLGLGLNGQASAIAVYNGQIHVSGGFTTAGGQDAFRIARWNGSSWHAVPGIDSAWNCRALAVYDGDLYMGGEIISAGGQPVNNITRWDGTTWHPLGSGVSSDPDQWGEVHARVFALTVFADELIVGGQFEKAGSQTVNRIARWNGQSWAPIGDGLEFSVNALAVYDGHLIAGGDLNDCVQCQGRVARWVSNDPDSSSPLDNGEWVQLGSPLNSIVNALAVFQGELVAGGLFTSVDDAPVKRIARWNEAAGQWQELDGGVTDASHPLPSVRALGLYHEQLVVSGIFNRVGEDNLISSRIATWAAPPSAGPADLNCDGVVDGADLLILLSAWGTCADPDNCPADLNGDGTIDGADLLILLSNWG